MRQLDMYEERFEYIHPQGYPEYAGTLPFLGKMTCPLRKLEAGSWQELVLDVASLADARLQQFKQYTWDRTTIIDLDRSIQRQEGQEQGLAAEDHRYCSSTVGAGCASRPEPGPETDHPPHYRPRQGQRPGRKAALER